MTLAPMTLAQWVAARGSSAVVHLDVAGAGRVSRAALAAEVKHLIREQQVGGYPAEAKAAPLVDAGRAALGALLGLDADAVAYQDGAGTAFAVLMEAWPLAAGARIGWLQSEYGGNAAVLRRLAASRDWTLVDLPVDPLGRILDVPAGLDLVTFPQVPSQRGIAQPVGQVLSTGVPVLLDVAQSLGQVAVPPGCAAYVGTSRKWLCGPRGIGFAVVAPDWGEQLAPPPTPAAVANTGVRRFEAPEAHVAGRVGLAVAVQEWTPDVIAESARLASYARTVLDGGGGWRVVEPVDEPTAITTLFSPAGADPFAARELLQQRAFVTSAVPVSRAADMTAPVLRVSTAAWLTEADIDGAAAVLSG